MARSTQICASVECGLGARMSSVETGTIRWSDDVKSLMNVGKCHLPISVGDEISPTTLGDVQNITGHRNQALLMMNVDECCGCSFCGQPFVSDVDTVDLRKSSQGQVACQSRISCAYFAEFSSCDRGSTCWKATRNNAKIWRRSQLRNIINMFHTKQKQTMPTWDTGQARATWIPRFVTWN